MWRGNCSLLWTCSEALKQQNIGLNDKRHHEGRITVMKLALKTVCLKPRKACFQSDPYQFIEIKHYPSFHKFLKSIYQEEWAYCKRKSWQSIYMLQGTNPRKHYFSQPGLSPSLCLVIELFSVQVSCTQRHFSVHPQKTSHPCPLCLIVVVLVFHLNTLLLLSWLHWMALSPSLACWTSYNR